MWMLPPLENAIASKRDTEEDTKKKSTKKEEEEAAEEEREGKKKTKNTRPLRVHKFLDLGSWTVG